MIGYIYKITNLLNNSVYIGKRQSPKFDNSYWGGGKIVRRAIKKYGKKHFKREVICWCETTDELCKQEIYWIKWYRDRDFLCYNICNGGEGAPGRICSEETKRKISESNKGKPGWNKGKHWWTEEQRQKMSELNSGKNNPRFGCKVTINTRLKMRNASPFKKKIILDNGQIFNSVADCARFLGCSEQHIGKVASGKKHSAKGHTLKYYN